MKLYLDDIRNPPSAGWTVVRNYEDFIETVQKYGTKIELISFDHDLALIHYDPKTHTESFQYTELTGYDCALFSIQFYDSIGAQHPKVMVHSMNPGGAHRIRSLFNK